MFKFRLKFHWSLFPRIQLTISQHWFRQWLGAEQATSHYLKQWWPNSMMHICIARPQWVNLRQPLWWWCVWHCRIWSWLVEAIPHNQYWLLDIGWGNGSVPSSSEPLIRPMLKLTIKIGKFCVNHWNFSSIGCPIAPNCAWVHSMPGLQLDQPVLCTSDFKHLFLQMLQRPHLWHHDILNIFIWFIT